MSKKPRGRKQFTLPRAGELLSMEEEDITQDVEREREEETQEEAQDVEVAAIDRVETLLGSMASQMNAMNKRIVAMDKPMSTLAEMKKALDVISAGIQELQKVVAEHDMKIKQMDEVLVLVHEETMSLGKKAINYEAETERLRKKVIDLEARSRRNNLRIIGLGEGTESGRLTIFFAELIQTVLGRELFPQPPELDRAHRSFGQRSQLSSKPRTVILCFNKFQVKDTILRESRRRGMLRFNDQNIRIVEDYPAEIMKERSAFKDVMAQLYQKKFRPSLRYPARLRITLHDGTVKWFNDPQAASAFLGSEAGPSTGP